MGSRLETGGLSVHLLSTVRVLFSKALNPSFLCKGTDKVFLPLPNCTPENQIVTKKINKIGSYKLLLQLVVVTFRQWWSSNKEDSNSHDTRYCAFEFI